jgi:poly-gamma-glutamate synthesis protein (capsule biosynthesis protein)
MNKLFIVAAAILVALAVFFAVPVVGRELAAIAERPVTAIFFGDLMLDRGVRADINAYDPGYPFEDIGSLVTGRDIVAANAEGVFGDEASVASFSNLVFAFPTSTLPALKVLGFTDFSQANNHALNFGWAGLASSSELVARAGMRSFGDPENNDPGPVYENVRGQLVAFVGYDQFSSAGGDDARVLAAIAQARQRGAFIVVYAHWGVEYQATTTAFQVSEAHRFVDAGADLVVGAHPHVVEPHEIYKGKVIFYSLGNFVFDQSWDDAVTHGLAVELSLTHTQAAYTLVPLVITHAQPAAASTTESFVLEK